MLITKQQRQALKKVYQRLENPPPYRVFRRTVQGTFFCDKAIVVQVFGMFLVIEHDGYTHS